MAINVSWVDDSKTIILRVFEGQWTWDEFNDSQQRFLCRAYFWVTVS